MIDPTLCGRLVPVRNRINSLTPYMYRMMLFDQTYTGTLYLFTETDIKTFKMLDEEAVTPLGLYVPHTMDTYEGIVVKIYTWKIQEPPSPSSRAVDNPGMARRSMVSRGAVNIVADLTALGEWVECTVFIRDTILLSGATRAAK